MSVRRRRVRERLERDRNYDSCSFECGLKHVSEACERALARGETRVTDEFLVDAFGPLADAMQRKS